SEEHTSELQSLTNLVCRLLLEKKKSTKINSRSSLEHKRMVIALADTIILASQTMSVVLAVQAATTTHAASTRTDQLPAARKLTALYSTRCTDRCRPTRIFSRAVLTLRVTYTTVILLTVLYVSAAPSSATPAYSSSLFFFFFLNNPPPPKISLFPLHAPFPI